MGGVLASLPDSHLIGTVTCGYILLGTSEFRCIGLHFLKNGKEIIIYVLKKCPMLSMKLLIHLDCHVVYARRVSAATALADADVGVTVNERLLGHTSDESN